MLELVASRAGPPTAVVRGAYLHSKYDPAAEAERFAAQALRGGHPSLVVLLGAGLGYLVEALQRLSPGVRVLPVFYDEAVYTRAAAHSSKGLAAPGLPAGALSSAWHPGCAVALLEHLRAAVRELDSEGLAVIEWPTSARLFPEVSRRANLAVHQLLKEHRGSLVTASALGRRWLRNAFRNFVLLERMSSKPRGSGTRVFIAASGPSLEQALRLLGPFRQRFSLWALPSSLLALRDEGLRPDLVVLTDPGYYAMTHLHPGARMGLEIAMPLSAACGAWRIEAAVLPLSHGTFFERALCELRSLEPITLPSFGTVAASALELARRLGATEILVAGLDLCQRDIRSHARPNVFDLFLEDRADRLSPFVHRTFSRDLEQSGGSAPAPQPRAERTSGGRHRPERPHSSLALETYAGWFAALPAGSGPRLYRLLPSEVALPAFTGLDEAAFRAYAEALPQEPAPALTAPARETVSDPAGRAAEASALLARWASALRRSSRGLRREALDKVLSDPLLLPLCYYCDAAALAEVHRRLRLAGPGEAADRLRRLAVTSAGFLDSIRCSLGT